MLIFLLMLAGAVALLLWGVQLVESGMQRAFGAKLRAFLSTALDRRLQAFAAGLAVTTALQSSTATGLMVTGFVGAGLVALAPALAVMLGAHVGTTLIVQVLAFPITVLVPVLAVVGLVMLRRFHGTPRTVGGVLLGLSLILLALHQLIDIVSPYGSSPILRLILDQLHQQPVMALVIAALLTWAAHSSVAIVLLVMSLATQEVVPLSTALALVLGANLGTALNPLLEGAAPGDRAARRLPIGNIVMRLAGIVAVLPLLDPIAAQLSRLGFPAAHLVALFHTSFNLALAIVFLPLLTPYAELLRRLLPDRESVADPTAPLYLSARGRETPALALARAAREALRLADALESMLTSLRHTFDEGGHERIREARSLDDVLDRLNTAIKTHVTSLDLAAMSELDHRHAARILAFTTNLEQAGDLIDSRLLPLASKRVERGLVFSSEGRAELLELLDRLQTNVRSAASVFVSADPRAARMLAEEKEVFRRIVAAAADSHYTRLRRGRISSIETSALHLDMLHVLKQVNSHLIEGAAYPLLEGVGALLPSRLRPEKPSGEIVAGQV